MTTIPFGGSLGGLSSLIAVFLVLTTTTLILRFVARVKQHNKPGIDDWLAIIPCLCFIIFFGLAIYGMVNGFEGAPLPANPVYIAPTWETERVDWSSNLVSIIALGAIRLSAVFFYRRIFCPTRNDLFSVATMVTIVLIAIWTIALFIASFLVCRGSVNDIFQADRDCGFAQWLYALAFSSIALDVLVIILPIPKIWSLHMTTGRKVSITIVFLLAGAGLGASLSRAAIVYFLLTQNAAALGTSDFYIASTKSCFYQYLEVGLGATTINLPSLWYFKDTVKPDQILRTIISLISIRSSSSSTKDEVKQGHGPDTTFSDSRSTISEIVCKDISISKCSLEFVEERWGGEPCRRERHEAAAAAALGKRPIP